MKAWLALPLFLLLPGRPLAATGTEGVEELSAEDAMQAVVERRLEPALKEPPAAEAEPPKKLSAEDALQAAAERNLAPVPLVGVPPAVASAPPAPALSLRRRAALLAQQGRYDEAASLFSRAVAARPQDVVLRKDLMWTVWYTGRYENAIAVAREVMAQSPNDLEALNLIGQAQIAMGNAEEALATFRRSFRINPKQLPVKKAIARALLQTGDFKTTETALRELTAKEPREPLWHSALGHVYFDHYRFAEAEAELRQAVALDPTKLEYQTKRAQALYFGGHKKEGYALLSKIAAIKPPYWPAILYAVDLASINSHGEQSAALLAGQLDEVAPQDEPKLMHLALLYRDLGMDKEFLVTTRRLLQLDPDNPRVLDILATYHDAHGNTKEAIRLAELAIKADPDFMTVRDTLINALEVSSQPVKALAAVEARIAMDPTDYGRLPDLARLYFDVGRPKEGRRLLLDWLARHEHEKNVLPIILYHGLTPYPDDPMLAAPIHLTVDRFDEQIGALRAAGYKPISAAQAADWFKGKAKLPPKPILVTFDDARYDSFRYGEPVLRKYGFKATMFSPMHNVELGTRHFANWPMIKEEARTGIWEIQAHGDMGHTFIRVDVSSHTGLFMVNRRWRPERKRLETAAEWLGRVREDHESSKRKIRKRLGYAPRVLAYPEGDYGQQGESNFAGAITESLHLCRNSYDLCFTQNKYGVNLRSRDPARAFRVEPRQDWTGAHLVAHFADENPFTRMYRALLAQDTWEKRPHDAFYWLSQVRAAGASPQILAADEANIRFTAGEKSQGILLAQQAVSLGNMPMFDEMLSIMKIRIRPMWTPGVEYYQDNRTRRNLRLSQSVGAWTVGANEWDLDQFYGTYKERDFDLITDLGGGAGYRRLFGPYQSLALGLGGHHYSAGVKDGVTAQGNYRSDWTDAFNTNLQGAYQPYDTAAALKAGVWERRGAVQAEIGREDEWDAKLQSLYANLTDHNQRYTEQISLAHPIMSQSNFHWMGMVLYDALSFVSPNYYSPQHLLQYQGGVGYKGELTPDLKVEASYLPGFGHETHSRDQFIQSMNFVLEKKWGDWLSIKPEFALTKTPTYQDTILSLSFSYRL